MCVCVCVCARACKMTVVQSNIDNTCSYLQAQLTYKKVTVSWKGGEERCHMAEGQRERPFTMHRDKDHRASFFKFFFRKALYERKRKYYMSGMVKGHSSSMNSKMFYYNKQH